MFVSIEFIEIIIIIIKKKITGNITLALLNIRLSYSYVRSGIIRLFFLFMIIPENVSFILNHTATKQKFDFGLFFYSMETKTSKKKSFPFVIHIFQ